MTWRKTPQRLLQLPNRSLNLTAPRAEFLVRSEYSEGSVLSLKQVLGDNTKNVSITSVQNGRRRLAPNRYTVAFCFSDAFCRKCSIDHHATSTNMGGLHA